MSLSDLPQELLELIALLLEPEHVRKLPLLCRSLASLTLPSTWRVGAGLHSVLAYSLDRVGTALSPSSSYPSIIFDVWGEWRHLLGDQFSPPVTVMGRDRAFLRTGGFTRHRNGNLLVSENSQGLRYLIFYTLSCRGVRTLYKVSHQTGSRKYSLLASCKRDSKTRHLEGRGGEHLIVGVVAW